jgi:hypothetical protein
LPFQIAGRDSFIEEQSMIFPKQQTVYLSLLCILTISFGFVVGLYLYYDNSMPSAPQPQVGRTHPLSLHGHIVYLTSFERLCYNANSALIFISGPLLLVNRLLWMYGVLTSGARVLPPNPEEEKVTQKVTVTEFRQD